MNQFARRRMAQKYLHMYARMKEEIDDFIKSTGNVTQKIRDDGGGHGSYISDPTARAAIRLMEPPEDIERYSKWVDAIDNAVERIKYIDYANQRYGDVRKGMMCIVKQYFLRVGMEPLDPEHNSEVRDNIIKYCKISMSTFYARIEKISDVVLEEYDKLK